MASLFDSHAISAAIGAATRQAFRLADQTATSGGCINQTYRICGDDGRQFFLKLNEANRLAGFTAEAAGLSEIAATRTVRVPQAVAHGVAGAHSFLVLEHLDLCERGDETLLGEQLAALHRVRAPRFGFSQDNFIGSTPQPNAWTDDWLTFWREQRLGFQLALAAHNGFGGRLQQYGAQLMDSLEEFFVGHRPAASLLHGDLWGGNHAFLADGTPVIFDPAPYYGDREADLAMTELFGGFGADFHAAYRAAYPLDEGYALRRDLYNLYHILNHANLFGGSYVRQAEQTAQRLLSELG